MRRAAVLLALILPACRGTAGELLTPDEFHLWASYTDGDSVGSIGSPRDSRRFAIASDGDYSTIGGGFTWYLDRRAHVRNETSAALRRIALALQPPTPSPVVPTPSPEPEPTPTPSEEPSPQAGSQDPEHDETEPHVTDWYVRLVAPLVAVLLALAGWINRQRIPYVRDWTARGRERRAEADDWDDGDGSDDPPPII